MKYLFALSILLLFSFRNVPPACGDGNLYAWEEQTKLDSRFNEFPKLNGKKNGPSYPGGDKALDALIREKLILDEEAKDQIFMLNYYFTVKCDGSIDDVVILGDPVVKDWTNIDHIIRRTTGWEPATIDGKAVDCIYFRKMMINGSKK